jgi:hypothetical protein
MRNSVSVQSFHTWAQQCCMGSLLCQRFIINNKLLLLFTVAQLAGAPVWYSQDVIRIAAHRYKRSTSTSAFNYETKKKKRLATFIYWKKALFVPLGWPLLGAGGRDRTGDETTTKSDAMTARPLHTCLQLHLLDLLYNHPGVATEGSSSSFDQFWPVLTSSDQFYRLSQSFFTSIWPRPLWVPLTNPPFKLYCIPSVPWLPSR